ncbi:MAG: hypothetical protein HPY50_02405 [Firmicutes bacterium]|nr:hypothetical protein [Bacillota bacterium]
MNDYKKDAFSVNPLKGEYNFLEEYTDKKLKQAYLNAQKAFFTLGELMVMRARAKNLAENVAGGKATFEKGILKISIPEVLPIGRYYTSESKAHWMGMITQAYMGLGKQVRMDHALCVIRTLTPSAQQWDNDNRLAVSHIINAIRGLGIVPDDTYEYLSLLQVGGVDETAPRTEILLLDIGSVGEFLDRIGLSALK